MELDSNLLINAIVNPVEFLFASVSYWNQFFSNDI